MERKILEHEVICGPNSESVKVEFVYNYIYDLYGDAMALLDEAKDISTEIAGLETERDIAIKAAGAMVADRAKREDILKQLDVSKEAKKTIRTLKKKLRAIDLDLRLNKLFPIIEGVLKDNGYEGPLLKFNYWDRSVDRGEAWRFIVALINKDSEKIKKKAEK